VRLLRLASHPEKAAQQRSGPGRDHQRSSNQRRFKRLLAHESPQGALGAMHLIATFFGIFRGAVSKFSD